MQQATSERRNMQNWKNTWVEGKKRKDVEGEGWNGTVTSELVEWLMAETPEISDQKSTVLGTSKILDRALKLPSIW